MRDNRIGRLVMSVAVSMPDDIQTALEGAWGDLARHVQENLAIDGYSNGLLTLAQVRRLLGLQTRFEAAQFLGSRGVAVIDFDPSELDREAQLLQGLAARR